MFRFNNQPNQLLDSTVDLLYRLQQHGGNPLLPPSPISSASNTASCSPTRESPDLPPASPYLPLGLPHDPRRWTKQQVTYFLLHCQKEFEIDNIDYDKFAMNGKAICFLTKTDFSDRCYGAGDLIYNLLHQLIKELGTNNNNQILTSTHNGETNDINALTASSAVESNRAALIAMANSIFAQNVHALSTSSTTSSSINDSLSATLDDFATAVANESSTSVQRQHNHQTPADHSIIHSSLLNNKEHVSAREDQMSGRGKTIRKRRNSTSKYKSSKSSGGGGESSNKKMARHSALFSPMSFMGGEGGGSTTNNFVFPKKDETFNSKVEDLLKASKPVLPECYQKTLMEDIRVKMESVDPDELHNESSQIDPSESGGVDSSNQTVSSSPEILLPTPGLLAYMSSSSSSCDSPMNKESFMNNLPKHPTSNGSRLLWDFIRQLLYDENDKFNDYIQWKDKENRVFKIADPQGLATLWGIQKNHLSMNYDKMSRALRYYYKVNILKKVQGERHCYQFSCNPTELKTMKLVSNTMYKKDQNNSSAETSECNTVNEGDDEEEGGGGDGQEQEEEEEVDEDKELEI